MNRFTKQLPALLSRTDVVLELRDSRLPLTSINNNLEGKLIFFSVYSNIRSRVNVTCMMFYFSPFHQFRYHIRPTFHFVPFLIRSGQLNSAITYLFTALRHP